MKILNIYVDKASDYMEDLNHFLNKYENWYDPCTETETDLFHFVYILAAATYIGNEIGCC